MKKILSILVFSSFYSTAFAVLGSRNPNHIYYGMNGYIVFRQCSNQLIDPSTTCELKDEAGRDSPVPLALSDKDFKESLFRQRADETLAGANLSRYLGAHGARNLAEDITFYEASLLDETIDHEEMEHNRDYLRKIRKLHSYFDSDTSLFSDLKKSEIEIVPASNKRVSATNHAFDKAGDKVLVFDPLSRVWWAYLGQGDYFDATNTRRITPYGKESENQRNLGGCDARIKGSKLPTNEQLRNINRQPQLAYTIKQRLNGAYYTNVWTRSGDIVGNEHGFIRQASAGFRRVEHHYILCVVETQ